MRLSLVLVLLQLLAALGHINAQPLRHSSSQLHQHNVHLHHHLKDPESSLPISSSQHVLESDFEDIAQILIESVVSPDKPLSSESFKSRQDSQG